MGESRSLKGSPKGVPLKAKSLGPAHHLCPTHFIISLRFLFLGYLFTHRGSETYNPEMKRRGLHRLSQTGPLAVFPLKPRELLRAREFSLRGVRSPVQYPSIGVYYLGNDHLQMEAIPAKETKACFSGTQKFIVLWVHLGQNLASAILRRQRAHTLGKQADQSQVTPPRPR